MPEDEAYYYDVDGSRVPLRRAPELAVDLNAAPASPGGASLEALASQGRELRGGIVMLDPAKVPDELAEELDAAGAVHPVYGNEADGFVVVLPEVRIETGSESEADRVRSHLEARSQDVEVVDDAGDRIVVRPQSGRGIDALAIANRLTEEARPAMAQARFLRVVRRA